jgi:transcriptional regulator with XRE-family HTH domain
MTETRVRTRTVLVVDNSHVARRVGDRIRQARLRASLTQAEVAKGRYTAAYVSALERGLAKPSMAALTFLSERLGVPITDLVSEDRPAAGRLEADLLLASGELQAALDRYDTLLEAAGDDRRQRAELLRGRAEALCRLGRAHDAIRPAAEAAELFDAIGAAADAAHARFWLACAQHGDDNTAEARGILHELLTADRGGLRVAPDFRARLLTALGQVETSDGEPERALAHMDEARSLLSHSSTGERARFLAQLALEHRASGDVERSIRVGHESLAVHRIAELEREITALEIALAVASIEAGDTERAEEHLRAARAAAGADGGSSAVAEVAEAEARLALARGDSAAAAERAGVALELARGGGAEAAAVGAHLTLARVAHLNGDRAAAEAAFEAAAKLLRTRRAPRRLRDVLAEWADVRSQSGDLEGANALYAEALGRGSGAKRTT